MKLRSADDRVFILAGNHAQAEHFASQHGLRRTDWFYINGPMSIRGCHDIVVVRVGTFLHRKDLRQIELECAMIGVTWQSEAEFDPKKWRRDA